MNNGVQAARRLARVACPVQYAAVNAGLRTVGRLAQAASQAAKKNFFVFAINPQELPKIPLSIANHVLPALWDPGAGCSYISKTTSKLLSRRPIMKTDSRAQGANGGTFAFIGELDCVVQIGSIQLSHRFLISADNHCPLSALIGLDFMKTLEIEGIQYYISLQTQTLTVGNNVISFLTDHNTRNSLNNMICLR